MISRRNFLRSTSAATGLGLTLLILPLLHTSARAKISTHQGFDPWVEIISASLRHNVKEVHRFARGARVMFVVKNNAYGLGLKAVAPVVDDMEELQGFAVVRVEEALALREAGVKKPILMMAHAGDGDAEELIRQNIDLTPFHDDSREQLERVATRAKKPARVQLYVDTGMNRIGMPHSRALPWIERMAASEHVKITGCYTMTAGAMRDDQPFDSVQLGRFLNVVNVARAKSINMGILHAAPSRMIVKTPASHALGVVRPGDAVYGGPRYETDSDGNAIMNLPYSFRLRARVVRIEQVAAGEGVSFGHRYIAKKPIYTATLPIGHTDGYPVQAAGRAKVLINGKLYPVLPGGVNANFVLIEVGPQPELAVGDVATLIGPDHAEIRLESLAQQLGIDGGYWIKTKLSALMRRVVV